MKCVLVVEDEVPVRRVVTRWLELEGAEVMEAGTAEAALSIARERDLAVAFCDVNLPAENGVWLARCLRAEQPTVAVVFATGVVDAGVAISGMQAGAVDYLIKPLSRERVVEALRRGLTTNASRHTLSQVNAARADLETSAEFGLAAVRALMEGDSPAAAASAQRVARLAVNLALMLDMREPEITALERAALLCDVCEMSFANHPVMQMPMFAAALDIAAIARGAVAPAADAPLTARILAVARAYDTLTSSRGGGRLSESDALVELTRRRAEFDPTVLQALFALRPGGDAR